MTKRKLGPLAALLFAAMLVFVLGVVTGHAQKRAPLPKVNRILTQELDDIEGREGRLEVVSFPPGAEAPRHRHPGHVFVYVLEGEIVSQLEEDGTAETFAAGDSFYEPSNGLHAVTRNPSETEDAKIITFLIMETGTPSLRFERSAQASPVDDDRDPIAFAAPRVNSTE